jgi:hypothetical protein
MNFKKWYGFRILPGRMPKHTITLVSLCSKNSFYSTVKWYSITTQESEETEKYQDKKLYIETSQSIIKPKTEKEMEFIKEYEKTIGKPSLYSYHKLAGTIGWKNEVIIHFNSPMDFMCFWEFFSIYKFYTYFSSRFYKEQLSRKEVQEWYNNLPKPSSPFFDVQSLYIAMKEDYLPITRIGDDLKVHKYIVDKVRDLTFYADQAIDILHYMPATAILKYTNYLIDPMLSEEPFDEYNFSEEFARIIKVLESDPKFQKEFPFDLRTFFLYESVKQKTLNLRFFNEEEIATENYHFLNVDLSGFYSTKEEAISTLQKLSGIVEDICYNLNKKIGNVDNTSTVIEKWNHELESLAGSRYYAVL